MDELAGKSEVARLMRRIELEEEAARRGLFGVAIVAKHELISARMTRGAERILRLVEQGKDEEAQALLNTEYWREDENAALDNTSEKRGARQ
jgi:hypothetical protein